MKKHFVRPEKKSNETGPKKAPSVVQLPGGIVARARDFRVVAVDAHGRPTAFELAEPGTDSDCVLWAADSFVDQPLVPVLRDRYEKRRVERSLKTDERVVYHKSRSMGISETEAQKHLPLHSASFTEVTPLHGCIGCGGILMKCACREGCPGYTCPSCDA